MIINGKNALTEFGVSMGEGFLNAISSPAPLKEFIENKSRLINGKQVLYDLHRMDEQEITLTFFLEGKSEADYLTKKRAFEAELYKGKVTIYVPTNHQTYRLTYQRSQSFAQNTARTFCKISVKFNEPDPSNRETEI